MPAARTIAAAAMRQTRTLASVAPQAATPSFAKRATKTAGTIAGIGATSTAAYYAYDAFQKYPYRSAKLFITSPADISERCENYKHRHIMLRQLNNQLKQLLATTPFGNLTQEQKSWLFGIIAYNCDTFFGFDILSFLPAIQEDADGATWLKKNFGDRPLSTIY